MPPLFYLIWYCAAAVVVVLVWARTARLRSSRGRLAIRLAAVTFGFTTVPLFGPDGGVWFPMGLYYLTGGSARLEARGKATLVIASVWLLLFVGVLGLGALWSAIRSRWLKCNRVLSPRETGDTAGFLCICLRHNSDSHIPQPIVKVVAR